MRISDLSALFQKNQQYQGFKNSSVLPAGSQPHAGHVNPFEDPDLNITGKSPEQWQKIIPVDETVAEELRNLIKEDFRLRSGMCGTGDQADAQANIIKKYVATLPGEKKLAAIYSCEQIAFQEADRIESKIREHNPDWQYGQPFDTSILDNDLNARI